MHQAILESLGLSKNEAKIYETLLMFHDATIGTVATHSKIHRRNIYDSVNRLIEKGLVFQVLGEGDNLYRPVSPDKLMELVEEKRQQLKKIMPELQATYKKEPQFEATYIYKGIEGFKNYLRDILIAEEDVYLIGAKGCWFDPRLKTFLPQFLKEAERKKIKFHHLFDFEIKKQLPEVVASVGKPYKFLPKKYSTPAMVDIFGDHVVSFTGAGLGKISDEMTIFVNISRPLATSYKTWFGFMWDMCPTTCSRKKES